ncbi:hypothetical protein BJP37_02105 [Moorena bouillonii PNG]|uniref:Uncharacterized protein n=1 Tax=Moorena bouillonii PNG TaxID=568701 RepID=A0A1U7MWB6_9CYAN|nr:hypothetical protein BJP37_02105 [Moorena bouillonii PNG]
MTIKTTKFRDITKTIMSLKSVAIKFSIGELAPGGSDRVAWPNAPRVANRPRPIAFDICVETSTSSAKLANIAFLNEI